MTTIYDIAKKCNVAASTVSRALNDDKRISKETRDRVKAMAKKLNYKQNELARSLKSGKSLTIGIITNDLATFAVPRIIDGIEEIANESGYNIIVGNTSNNMDKEAQYIDILSKKQIEGIIFVGTWAELDKDCPYLDIDLPFVAINRHYHDERVITINHDDINVGYIGTKYLIDKGYNKIAFINGPMEEISPPNRLKGYKKALVDNELKVNKNMIFSGEWHFDTGYNYTNEILKNNNQIDAIVCSNDQIASGSIYAIREKNKIVPEDIAVIGCDDRNISRNFKPLITTIRLPLKEMGISASKKLIDMINNKKVTNEVLTSSILERDSA
jgi:DNA-binding LacI/PurR family transcriptional regulator